jgi:uncharacterized protein (TIGR02466 family)
VSDPFTPTQQLFSFPLFSSLIAGFDEHRAPLLELILDLRERYPGVTRSNRNAWHSGDELLQHRSEHVAWLLGKVLKFGRLSLGRYYDDWARADLQLAGAWANVLGPGGWNAPHHHFPTHWSGVVYIQCSPVIPGDPAGMIEFLNPTPYLSYINQPGNFAHAPKEGLTIVFPASLVHYVHPHAGDAPRVSIAYNFNVVKRQSGAG